jgi:flavin reductase (DIM6/NTAB) family NADH-FMN oxidoreductase RutF/DNA-binding IclR family transcriptional regulator
MTVLRAHDPSWFRQILGQYPTGVTVITAMGTDGEPAGMAVGSFTSVSLSPPLVAFFPDKSSSTWPRIRLTGAFCVNVLGADQEDVCRLFATKGVDRFAQFKWRRGESGAPILDGAVAWIDCAIELVQDAGDHYIVIGRVRDLDLGAEELPLLFYRGGYGRFAPFSMAAVGSDFSHFLRRVDVARRDMETIAAELGLQCVASADVHGDLVVLATAGQPIFGIAAPVGQRVPLMPPIGVPLVAWASDAEITAWKHRFAANLRPAIDRRCDEMLATVRGRQFSIATGGALHMELTATNEKLELAPGDHELLAHRLEVVQRLFDSYEPPILDDASVIGVRGVNAPIFGEDGNVVFMLSLFGLPESASAAEVERYAERLLVTAKTVTARLHGSWPPPE